MGSSPNSPLRVFLLLPLRVLPLTWATASWRLWPRCSVSSASGLLHQQLGQLLEQAVLANQVFRLLVIGQQARQQFLQCFVLLGCHCVCGQAGSRLRWIVRLHKILQTLGEPVFRFAINPIRITFFSFPYRSRLHRDLCFETIERCL